MQAYQQKSYTPETSGLVPGYWTLSGQQVGEQYLQVKPLWFVLFLYLLCFAFYPEVFETKWKLQTGVESNLCSGCACVEMSRSGEDGPYHSNLL